MSWLKLLRCITCPFCGPLEGTLETLYDYDSVLTDVEAQLKLDGLLPKSF
jgi:hypothetical protein